jgi:hypothetical protein
MTRWPDLTLRCGRANDAAETQQERNCQNCQRLAKIAEIYQSLSQSNPFQFGLFGNLGNFANLSPGLCGIPEFMQPLTHCHDDQDNHSDSQDDPNQVSFTKGAGSEIGLGLVGAHRQLRQLLIVKSGDSRLHLLRIHLRRLQSFFCHRRGKEMLNRLDVILAHLRRRHDLLLQIGRADNVSLRYEVAGKKESYNQNKGTRHSGELPGIHLHDETPQRNVPARKKVYTRKKSVHREIGFIGPSARLRADNPMTR